MFNPRCTTIPLTWLSNGFDVHHTKMSYLEYLNYNVKCLGLQHLDFIIKRGYELRYLKEVDTASST